MRGCQSVDAVHCRVETCSRQPTSSVISATAGEFLIECVFSLYVHAQDGNDRLVDPRH